MGEYLPVNVINKDKPCFFIDYYPFVIVHSPSLYVDKTLLVEEFLRGSKIALVLRPRRFGKTINLSMLCEFFSIHNDTATLKKYFEKTLIYSRPLFHEWAGTRPIIYLSFHVGPITTLQ
jgi:Predicted AAA-ATPase